MDINEYILRAYKNNSASHDEKKDSSLKSKDKKMTSNCLEVFLVPAIRVELMT